MAINWDPIINAIIMIAIGIWLTCAVTKKSVPELISSISDIINGTKDDVLEKGEELLYYD